MQKWWACSRIKSAGPVGSHPAFDIFRFDEEGRSAEHCYKAIRCVEAQVYDQRHVEEEPYDCQMECE